MIALLLAILMVAGFGVYHWRRINREYGFVDMNRVCWHCGNRGTIMDVTLRAKGGLSAGRIAGGVATGGLSLLSFGVHSRKWVADVRCANCGPVTAPIELGPPVMVHRDSLPAGGYQVSEPMMSASCGQADPYRGQPVVVTSAGEIVIASSAYGMPGPDYGQSPIVSEPNDFVQPPAYPFAFNPHRI